MIKYDEEAIKFLEKLDFNLRKRIFNKISSTKENPRYFERLKGHNLYRVGDYRVIAEIDEDIRIMKVGHRRNIYGHNL